MDTCAVCLDPVRPTRSATRTRCGHMLHRACMQRVLLSAATRPACPLCREPIDDARALALMRGVPEHVVIECITEQMIGHLQRAAQEQTELLAAERAFRLGG